MSNLIYMVVDNVAIPVSQLTVRVASNGATYRATAPGYVPNNPGLVNISHSTLGSLLTNADVDSYKEIMSGLTQLDGSGLYAQTHPPQTKDVKVVANLPSSYRTTLDFSIIPGDEINGATVLRATHFAQVGFNFTEIFYG